MSQHNPTYKYIIWLAIPGMLSALLNNIYRLVDQYFVQWLSPEAQAALGASTFLLFTGYALFVLISAGVGPYVARYTGAQNQIAVQTIVTQALKLSAAAGLLFSLVLVLGSSWLPSTVGLEGKAATELQNYLFWLGISGSGMAFGPLLDSIWIARGNTQTPMYLQIISTLLNVVLNAIFIFELSWGIMGAALASGISRWIVVLVGIPMLLKELPWQGIGSTEFKKILTMGFPVSMGIVLYSGVYWAIMYLCISPLGNSVHIALGLGFSVLEGISYPLYSGIMVAVSSMIGRQLGAKEYTLLNKTIKRGAMLCSLLGFLTMMIFLLFAEAICGYFTQSVSGLEQAVLYAHILAFSQVFVALEAMAEGVLSGSGDNKRLFWLSAPFNIMRVPLAYFFCFTLFGHAAGIWWAINITTYIKCALKWHAVYKGAWRKLEL